MLHITIDGINDKLQLALGTKFQTTKTEKREGISIIHKFSWI